MSNSVVVIPDRTHWDDRGSFTEIWNQEAFEKYGITDHWVQDNLVMNKNSGIFRGFHRQPGMNKLVRVVTGQIIDLILDPDTWQISRIDLIPGRSVYIPWPYYHGYYTTGPSFVTYKVTEFWDPLLEEGVRWNDPVLEWPLKSPRTSNKDKEWPSI